MQWTGNVKIKGSTNTISTRIILNISKLCLRLILKDQTYLRKVVNSIGEFLPNVNK